jgi:hypothetical protein
MGMGALGLIGSVASTGLQIYGMSQQAGAQKQAARYNALLMEREAANREAETSQAIVRRRQSNVSALSEIRAALAAAGTRTTTGSPLGLMGEAAGRMDLDIADAARAAAMQAASLRAKGAMGLWESKQAGRAANIGMLGAGISGLSSAWGKYSDGRYQGLF